MNKTILVFEVNEFTYEAINEYFTGDITLHLGNDGYIDFKDAILQPIPQFKNEHFKSENWELGEIINAEGRGWNDCLNEMLGVNDETTGTN